MKNSKSIHNDKWVNMVNTSGSVLTQFNAHESNNLTWNIVPLLHQIKHALSNLIDNNINEIIDLRSIPLAPGEEDKLLEILGQGEVIAKLDALGPSEIVETKYSGVWLVTHFNGDNEIVSRHIEITFMPQILSSQKEDVNISYNILVSTLDEKPAGTSE